jgi:hypothetical protein
MKTGMPISSSRASMPTSRKEGSFIATTVSS